MVNIKSLLSIGIAAAALAVAPAVASAADLSIGALIPLSGPNAAYGTIYSQAIDLAVDHVNAEHLVDGKFSVKYEDSQALPQPAVIGMNKLVNVDKAPYVMSAFTGVTKAISSIAARTKTVVINGGGVGPDLAQLGPYVWNDIPLANDEVEAMLPYLVNKRHLKRFVLVYIDDPLGSGIKQQLTERLPKLGATLVKSFSVQANAQQFSGTAALVRAANPDVIYIASYGAQEIQLIKQFRDNGITQQLVSYSAFSIPEVQALPEAKGSLFTTQHFDWNSQEPVTKGFVDAFRKKYNKMPTAYAANYYNATLLAGILGHDLEQAKKPITGENMLEQRLATKSFDLVGGKVSFTKEGTIISPIQINEVDGAPGAKVIEVANQ